MRSYTQQQALEWKARYEAGESASALAADLPYSDTTIRTALRSVGTVMRPRGAVPCRNSYAEQQANEWRARYEAGEALDRLALDVGISPSTMRKALLSVGTVMRPKGGRGRPNAFYNSVQRPDGIKGKSVPGKHRASPHSFTGHRRRSRRFYGF